MIAIDTNVVVRLVANDDPAQVKRAQAVVSKESIHLSSEVLMETEWVLRRSYGLGSSQIADSIERICGLPNVELDAPEAVAEALTFYRSGLDFADALHVLTAQAAGCAEFATFDKSFLKRAQRQRLAIKLRAL